MDLEFGVLLIVWHIIGFGIIVNSSRQILYSDNSTDYAKKSAEVSSLIQKEMSNELSKKGII